MRYAIDPEVFIRFPGFSRAVVVARGVDNTREHAELAALLASYEETARGAHLEDFRNHPRLAPWAEAFTSLGLNPNKFPPSVLNLVKRVRAGKSLPYVNSLVAIFNCVSLGHLCPCGGDDLDAVQGDLLLTFAKGTEEYMPLGQPEVLEHPAPGEIIYMDTTGNDVFCRAWCWKNGDRSKLVTGTMRAVINVDAMLPFGGADLAAAAADLAALLQRFTGAHTDIHMLDKGNNSFHLEN